MSQSLLLRSFAVVTLMLATVTVLPAQSVANLATPSATVMVPAATDAPIGPRATQSAVTLPLSAAETALNGSLQGGGTDRTNVAWIAVGAAALMIGLLVGGDAGAVVAIGGGVIALVGLFRYMS